MLGDAGNGKVQRLAHLSSSRVDDLYGTAHFRRDPQLLAVPGKFDMAWPQVDRRLGHHRLRFQVDPVDDIILFGRDHDPLAIRALRHAFRFAADIDLEGDGAGGEVDRSQCSVILIGDEQGLAVARQEKLLRVLPGGQFGDDLACRPLDHLHRMVQAGAQIEILAVLRQGNAARPAAHRPCRGDATGCSVDHADAVAPFVRDIEGFGMGGGRQQHQPGHQDALHIVLSSPSLISFQ